MALVSVITPLFNGAKHIEANIASVKSQSMGDYEHIIIDNASTDNGPDLVARAAHSDPRIKLLSNPDIPGAGPTRNEGIAAAKGKYIAFLDCDDMWRPQKLELQIKDMQERELALSWTAYQILDLNDDPKRIQKAKERISYNDLLAKRVVIGCLTVVYDAEILGKKFMCDLPMRQDFCLWLDIIKECDERGLDYAGLDTILADYRAGGMTSSKLKAAKAQWIAYRTHLELGRLATLKLFIQYAAAGIASRLPVG